MNITYHLTILPPAMPGTDAVVREIEVLRNHFGGQVVYLNPNHRLPLHVPRIAFGFHKLSQIRELEQDGHIHHFFNPDPFAFPILRRLGHPIIYSLTGGVGASKPNIAFFSSLDAITVADERSLRRLRSWGLENVHLVRPGLDTTRFTCSPLPLRSEIKLMVGSAPWNRAQFRTKGIDALLAVAQRTRHLRLVFLWRNVLAEEMIRRIRRRRLGTQAQVLNEKVDVNAVLAGVHASIALATHPAIIRPYPHSLLESLAAGKPVILSKSIPMADYVERTGCGKVTETLNPADIVAAIESLTREYKDLQHSAHQVGQRDFAERNMVTSFGEVYERILGG